MAITVTIARLPNGTTRRQVFARGVEYKLNSSDGLSIIGMDSDGQKFYAGSFAPGKWESVHADDEGVESVG